MTQRCKELLICLFSGLQQILIGLLRRRSRLEILHGIDVLLNGPLRELCAKCGLCCLQQLMGFIDHYVGTAPDQAAGRIGIFSHDTCQEEIVVCDLVIDRVFPVCSLDIIRISTFILIGTATTSALDTDLILYGSGHVPHVEVKPAS